jgi:hypothetical protein
MTDYWINPKRGTLGVVAISDDEMSIFYMVNRTGKQQFREAMSTGTSLRHIIVGPGETLSLKDITCVWLSPWWRSVHLEYVEEGQKREHCVSLWDRDTYDKVVEVLRKRLGPGWELKKGRAKGGTWRDIAPGVAFLLLLTVVGFWGVRQSETGEADQFRGRKGAVGRAVGAVIARSIASVGCFFTGLVLTALFAMLLLYRPTRDQLVPVTELKDDSQQSRRGPDG